MYSYSWFMLYSRNQHSFVKQLYFNLKKNAHGGESSWGGKANGWKKLKGTDFQLKNKYIMGM